MTGMLGRLNSSFSHLIGSLEGMQLRKKYAVGNNGRVFVAYSMTIDGTEGYGHGFSLLEQNLRIYYC
jgi:hypothetical protein